MRTLLAYVTILVAAAVPWLEVLLVVPVGILAGLSPAVVVIVAAVGNIASLVPLVLAGDRLRGWWRQRRGRAPSSEEALSGRGERARRLFSRYGLPGVALLGPLLTGIHVAALVALAAGADRRRALWWSIIGVVAWSVVTGVATVVGIEALVDPDALPDLGL